MLLKLEESDPIIFLAFPTSWRGVLYTAIFFSAKNLKKGFFILSGVEGQSLTQPELKRTILN
jgi:hypothetical protein